MLKTISLLLLLLLSWPVIATAQTAHGHIVGIAAVERSGSVQANGDRLVVLYLFFYNDTNKVWKVKGGDRALIDPDNHACPLFRAGGKANFSVPPGGVALTSPSYTYKGDKDLRLTLVCQDQTKPIRFEVAPQATSDGPYLNLPQKIQSTVETTIRSNPAFRWWGNR